MTFWLSCFLFCVQLWDGRRCCRSVCEAVKRLRRPLLVGFVSMNWHMPHGPWANEGNLSHKCLCTRVVLSPSSCQYPSRGIRTEGSVLPVPLRVEPHPCRPRSLLGRLSAFLVAFISGPIKASPRVAHSSTSKTHGQNYLPLHWDWPLRSICPPERALARGLPLSVAVFFSELSVGRFVILSTSFQFTFLFTRTSSTQTKKFFMMCISCQCLTLTQIL